MEIRQQQVDKLAAAIKKVFTAREQVGEGSAEFRLANMSMTRVMDESSQEEIGEAAVAAARAMKSQIQP